MDVAVCLNMADGNASGFKRLLELKEELGSVKGDEGKTSSRGGE